MRSASGWPDLARSSRIRPNAAWVDSSAPSGTGSRSGTGTACAAMRGPRAGQRARVDEASGRRRRHCRPVRHRATIPRPPRCPDRRAVARSGVGIHQARMIVLVPGEGQAIALDGIGDEQRRHVVVAAGKGVEQGLDAMPAQIGHQRGERGIVVSRDQLAGGRVGAQIGDQPGAPGRPALIGQRREFGIGAIVDPVGDRRAAGPGEGFALLAAMLQRHRRASRRSRRCRRSGGTCGPRWCCRATGGCNRRSTSNCGCRAYRPRSGIRRYCPRRARHRPSTRSSGPHRPRPSGHARSDSPGPGWQRR